MRGHLSKIGALTCLVAVLAGNGGAQTSSIAPMSPLSRNHNGWQLYNVSASLGYSSLALPPTLLSVAGLGRLESDFDGTAAASFGYNFTGSKSSITMLYSPSVVGRVRYSQLSALNQSLSLTVSHKLGRQWDWSLALGGADATLDQLLFTPALLSTTTAPIATADDLIGAIRGGQYTSDQLASILTGTPYVVTPSRSIVYGSKYLSTSLGSTVTFRYSPRLRFTFDTGAVRSQTRNDQGNNLQTVQNFLIPRTTTIQGGTSINYAVSPRTEIGGRGSLVEIDSTFGRYVISKAEIQLSRKISPHWFTNVSGGPAQMRVLRAYEGFSGQLKTGGPSYTFQGSVGYTLGRASALIGSYSKSAGDTYGFGSQKSESFAGSWQWILPGRSWGFYASSGFQRQQGGALGDLRYRHINAGFSRSLNRKTALSFAFGYVGRITSAGSVGPQQNLQGFSTRVTLVWDPFGKGEAQSPGIGSGTAGSGGAYR